MDTKTITFEGREYKVPVWVQWVARDSDGDVFGYETKPSDHKFSWVSNDLITAIRCDDDSWRDSLTKV